MNAVETRTQAQVFSSSAKVDVERISYSWEKELDSSSEKNEEKGREGIVNSGISEESYKLIE